MAETRRASGMRRKNEPREKEGREAVATDKEQKREDVHGGRKGRAGEVVTER